ncbi:MAG: hypothetical protein ACE5I1_22915 [bacterium]
MTLIRHNKANELLRLRCNACLDINVFPIERLLKWGQLLTEEEYEKRKEALSQVMDYSPKKTYWHGQKIRHKDFDDVGKVVKKEKTDGNHRVIIVKFDKVGKKKLIEGLVTVKSM